MHSCVKAEEAPGTIPEQGTAFGNSLIGNPNLSTKEEDMSEFRSALEVSVPVSSNTTTSVSLIRPVTQNGFLWEVCWNRCPSKDWHVCLSNTEVQSEESSRLSFRPHSSESVFATKETTSWVAVALETLSKHLKASETWKWSYQSQIRE